MENISAPFSNAQLEILKAFSRPMSDEDLIEFRTMLGQYFSKKVSDEADRLWEERGYTNETMEQWLREGRRK
jgi:hypothetical protein